MDILPNSFARPTEMAGIVTDAPHLADAQAAPDQLGAQHPAAGQTAAERPDPLYETSSTDRLALYGQNSVEPTAQATDRRPLMLRLADRVAEALAAPAAVLGLGVVVVGATAAMAKKSGGSKGGSGSGGSGDGGNADPDARVKKILADASKKHLTEAAAKVREAAQQYGENSPEALQAVVEYGKTEQFWKPPTE